MFSSQPGHSLATRQSHEGAAKRPGTIGERLSLRLSSLRNTMRGRELSLSKHSLGEACPHKSCHEQPMSRNRQIMFRLKQEEFNCLEVACGAAGTRSLSEFVRTRVLRAVNEPEFADFEKRLDKVNRTLTQLIKLVAEKTSEPGRHSTRKRK
jgi:hypothetical protein